MISTLGCAIEGAKGPSAGKKCELYIDWRGAQIGVEAQVVWKDAEERMGLKFLSVDKDTKKRLSDLCATLRIQPLSAPLPQEADAALSVPDSAKTRQPVRASGMPATGPSLPPGPARARERRRVPRYISELPARVSNPATGAASSVTVVTLSVLGGCLEGSELPEAGEKCDLDTEWDGKPLLVRGDIVWKSKEERVGVKFASLEEGAEKLLRQICANLRLEPLAPLPSEPE